MDPLSPRQKEMGWERLTLGEGLQEQHAESARAQEGRRGRTRYQSWEAGAGMIPAGFTEAAAWSPLSAQDALGAGMKTRSPGTRGAAPARAAGRGVDQSARTGIPGPHLGSPGAQVRFRPASAPPARPGPARPPPALSLRAAPGSPPPPGDLGASAERKRGAAPARGGGDAAWQRPAAPQVLFRPRLCWQLPAARGRADERALCLRPSGPARLSFLI